MESVPSRSSRSAIRRSKDWTRLVTAACAFPYVVYSGIWPSLGQLPVLAGFGMLQMAVPYVLFARGLRSISSQEATVIGLLEPILLPVAG